MNLETFLLAIADATTEKAPAVADEPTFDMDHWSVFEVTYGGKGHQFLVGCEAGIDHGRRSTPVVEWSYSQRTARTRSGRIYRLHGLPGRHPDAMWVWSMTSFGIPYADVTDQIWQQIMKT